MSTPANIIILNHDIKINKKLTKRQQENLLNNQIVLYIHSDGGNLKEIFLNDFLQLEGAKARQKDANYLINWMASYYNISRMAKYLNDSFMSSIRNKDIKNYRIALNNYEFKESDFKKLSDFRGSGFYIYGQIYFEYLYLICPIDSDPANFVKCENNFIIYQFDDNFKLLNRWEV